MSDKSNKQFDMELYIEKRLLEIENLDDRKEVRVREIPRYDTAGFEER